MNSVFEAEKSAFSHNLFYILALSSVNIFCSVSSNAGSCLGTRGAFPVSLHAQRSDGFCILCERLAHLVASYALTPAMLADYVFAALYLMDQVHCVGFGEQESPHRAQRNLRMSLLECLWLAHWSWECGEKGSWDSTRGAFCTEQQQQQSPVSLLFT